MTVKILVWGKECVCVCGGLPSLNPPLTSQGPKIKSNHYILPFLDNTMYSEKNKVGEGRLREVGGEGLLF